MMSTSLHFFWIYGLALMPRIIYFWSSIANRVSNSVVTDQDFVDHVQSILAYGSTFEAESDIKFSAGRTDNIARDLQASSFILGPSAQTLYPYNAVAKRTFALRSVRQLMKEVLPTLFEITSWCNRKFQISNAADNLFLLTAHAKHFCDYK